MASSTTNSKFPPPSRSNSASSEPQCRYCLSTGSTEDDPLICPCVCTAPVHLSCLNKFRTASAATNVDHIQSCAECKNFFIGKDASYSDDLAVKLLEENEYHF